MSDIADSAQAAEAAFHDAALRHRRFHGQHYADAQGALRPADCADCGEPIPAQRLATVPEATRCAFCQGQVEAREIR